MHWIASWLCFKAIGDLYRHAMYRGVAGLIGTKLHPITKDVKTEFQALKEVYSDYDYLFMHVKYTDSRGEDDQY